VKVTVPVGAGPPLRPVTVAVSMMGCVSATCPVAWVVRVGVARCTTDVSPASLQAPVTGA
jgi:hypothetical protein